MAEPSVIMEVERVMNLVSGFGWEKVKEEIILNEIHITIRKESKEAAKVGEPIGPT